MSDTEKDERPIHEYQNRSNLYLSAIDAFNYFRNHMKPKKRENIHFQLDQANKQIVHFSNAVMDAVPREITGKKYLVKKATQK